ncbi:MAG: sulfite exporter TauE/SafE family protein [Rickettsiales bacterium]|nr:sulfite exporter TauE/SafE family protein [Rickettsiales bacterium]
MIVLGYLLAVLMGTTLGLIGAGGSILTVPILVYFFQISPVAATSYSLAIVGSAALVGALLYYKRGLVNIEAAITFAFPATIAVICTRIFVVPNLPEKLFGASKENLIMLVFATLMLVAAFFMMKRGEVQAKPNLGKAKFFRLAFKSAAIGFLTGIVGAGGGFVIIPALVIFFNLALKEAVGTSLLIISINSLFGFKSDLLSGVEVDWKILLPFLALTIFGMLFGTIISKKLDGQKLKKIFALLMVAVAAAIFVQLILI